MKAKISIAPGQPAREAERVEIERADERWNEYQLADGSTLRVRQVATEAWRIVDEYDPEGNPLYVLKTAGVLTINAPESLKRKVN
jgi:hypothetical protein